MNLATCERLYCLCVRARYVDVTQGHDLLETWSAGCPRHTFAQCGCATLVEAITYYMSTVLVETGVVRFARVSVIFVRLIFDLLGGIASTPSVGLPAPLGDAQASCDVELSACA